MARKSPQRLLIVDDLQNIPDFSNEEEEAMFWDTHMLSEKLLAQMRPLTDEEAPRPRHTRAISLRMDEGVLERLQAIADKAQVPYQTLLKRFVRERIEQEERGETAKNIQDSSRVDAPSSGPARGKVTVSAVPAGTPEHRVYVLDVWADAVTVDDTFSFTEVFVHSGGGGYFYTHHKTQMTLDETISYLMEIRDRPLASQP